VTDTIAYSKSTGSHRHRERKRDQPREPQPSSSERREVYQRRVYLVTCVTCGVLGEVQGAHAVGSRLREHARTCRADAYGVPTGKVVAT
jgi:hypothetical protein